MNDYYGFYVMNAGSSTWRRESIKAILDAFASDGYNGLFEDDTWYRIERWSGDSYPPIAYSDSAWRGDMYEFLDSIRTVIHPRPAYFNGLYATGSDSLLLHADGGMTEGFAYTHWSGAQSGSAWKNQAEVGLRCTRTFKKTWMALGGAPQDDTDGRLYTLASYLLVADSMSMYANATSYQEFAHFPEFDLPLGRALTTVHTNIDTLLLPASAGMAPCYAREYERATVVVNPHAALPALYPAANGRMRIACTPGSTIDGSRIETIPATDTIPPKSARIYLNAGPLASPSIDSIEVFPQPARADDSTMVTLRALLRDASHGMYRVDSSLPLYVTADLGKLGGPKELRLVNDGSPASGAASWYEGRFTIPYGAPPHGADVPVTAFSTTGLAAVRYTRIEVSSPDSSNLLLNFSFEFDDNEDGTPDNWKAYVKGFVYDTLGSNAVTGRRSIHTSNDSLAESRGVHASITLNQPFPQNLEVSGWSKSIGVSEPKNNDYSIYVDAWYADGTPLYGQCARFNPGTHDWEYSSRIIRPEKPIRNISVYVIFRGHTGEAWFDQIAVRPSSEPDRSDGEQALPSLPALYPPAPNPARHSAALRFELAKPASLHIRLYDALGRIVLSQDAGSYSPGSHTTKLDLRGLAPGVYRCAVQSGFNSIHTVPIVVK